MIAALYAAAAVAFFGTAALYFRGLFRTALVGGAVYGGLIARVVWASMGPVPATVSLLLLLLGPAIYVGVHILDARKGLFLLPTIYSIPIAFLAGGALLAVAGVAVAL